MYEIRLCRNDEISLLKTFLENSWSQNHIFLRNEDVLNFQHQRNSGYNFVVAYHQETNSFHGVLGIISPEFYIDRIISNNQDVWLAIWKVEKSLAKSNSLGIDMLNYVDANFKPRSVSAIGINDNVALLYKLMGFELRKLKQWFIPNKNVVNYSLIVGDMAVSSNKNDIPSYQIVECGFEEESWLETFLSNSKAKRSFKYLAERYLNHPTYNYKVFAFLESESDVFSVVVGREVIANGSKAFRLTELFLKQDASLSLSASFDELMLSNSYEYIDFLEYGFDETLLVESGFILCTNDLFVPHLFEPFVADRKEVTIAYRSKFPFNCTKGDSDLDRPNQG